MQKKLIHTNKNSSHSMAKAWETQKGHLQSLLDLYNTTGLPALNTGELYPIFANTLPFLFDKLTNGEQAHLTVGTGGNRTHMAIDKAKALEIMIKPVWFDNLVSAIRRTEELLNKGIAPYHTADVVRAKITTPEIAQYLVINEGVQYSGITQSIISEAGKYYVESEAAKKVIAFVEATVKAYYENGINAIAFPQPLHIHELIEETIAKMDAANKTFTVNTDIVQRDRTWCVMEGKKSVPVVHTWE